MDLGGRSLIFIVIVAFSNLSCCVHSHSRHALGGPISTRFFFTKVSLLHGKSSLSCTSEVTFLRYFHRFEKLHWTAAFLPVGSQYGQAHPLVHDQHMEPTYRSLIAIMLLCTPRLLTPSTRVTQNDRSLAKSRTMWNIPCKTSFHYHRARIVVSSLWILLSSQISIAD
jgi:hypothetical protein